MTDPDDSAEMWYDQIDQATWRAGDDEDDEPAGPGLSHPGPPTR